MPVLIATLVAFPIVGNAIPLNLLGIDTPTYNSLFTGGAILGQSSPYDFGGDGQDGVLHSAAFNAPGDAADRALNLVGN